MTITIQAHGPIISHDGALADVFVAHATEREITGGTARTIASWWQSPGKVGRHLAALASGRSVPLTDLLDDVNATRRQLPDMDETDDLALDMLCTWAIREGGQS